MIVAGPLGTHSDTEHMTLTDYAEAITWHVDFVKLWSTGVWGSRGEVRVPQILQDLAGSPSTSFELRRLTKLTFQRYRPL